MNPAMRRAATAMGSAQVVMQGQAMPVTQTAEIPKALEVLSTTKTAVVVEEMVEAALAELHRAAEGGTASTISTILINATMFSTSVWNQFTMYLPSIINALFS